MYPYKSESTVIEVRDSDSKKVFPEFAISSSGSYFQIKNTDHETLISAEYVNMIDLKNVINDHLTTWTEWTSCSPYCKRSRHRVCSGEFECYDQADGISEPVLCTGDNCEAEHEECKWDEGECFKELRDDRLPINPKENPNYAGRQLDDSPKLCYDEHNNNNVDHPRTRRAVGARPESYI